MALVLMSKKQGILVPNMILKSRYFFIWLLVFATIVVAHGQDDKLLGGVQVNDGASADGYVLFAPHVGTRTYLIDYQGQVMHVWNSAFAPASALYLLDNGHLLRAGRSGGAETDAIRVIEELDWDSNVVWQYRFDAPRFTQHHDIQPLPNGNILVLAKELIPMEEAIELGFNLELLETIPDRNTNEELTQIELDSIFEINPETDAIVWEWHVSDHLVQDTSPDLPNYGDIADFPRRININYHNVPAVTDITHMNSITYNADSDLVLVSVRSFSEIWMIDHSISTEEAQGTQGDLMYRWGNPATYGQGTNDNRTLYFQHDARWLDATQADSNLMVFNNGDRSTGQSHVIEFVLPTELMTDIAFNSPEIIWESSGDFFAINMSGAQNLPDGNVLVTLAPDGHFLEITRDNEVVWEYINPIYKMSGDVAVNRVFRASYYPADFIGFADKDLQPQGKLRINVRP